MELQNWALLQFQTLDIPADERFEISSASDDASFRRYFRGVAAGQSFIFVDAPPDKEDNVSFVDINKRLARAGVPVPTIYAKDLSRGFLMLSDLGDRLLLPELKLANLETQERWYQVALGTLNVVQQASVEGLPVYDRDRLNVEMALFPDWFVSRQLEMSMTASNQVLFSDLAEFLIEAALEQPRVFVHRDYHARNLMPQSEASLGVIDFQDAVQGPVTYDLVSLLKDCYWRLPRASVVTLVESFRLQKAPHISQQQFLRWFDLMGFQRHLKCAGIFSRLNLRDGKPGYLGDIPLVVDYLQEVAGLYEELMTFGVWLEREIKPAMAGALS
jgi:aminoglycoside/choline kinase family phosphotransferase